MAIVYTYNQDGTHFSNIYQPSILIGDTIGNKNYVEDNGNITDAPRISINSIDIDLCGADIGNGNYLHTFEDLIAYINSLETRLKQLE